MSNTVLFIPVAIAEAPTFATFIANKVITSRLSTLAATYHPLHTFASSSTSATMLGRSLAYMALLDGTITPPQRFVLDMGGIDGASREASPALLLNTTNQAFNWPTTLLTASSLAATSAHVHTPVSNSSITAAATIAAFVSCLPTTTIIITLPSPTSTPKLDTSDSSEIDTLTNTGDATPFDSATPEPLSKRPHWFTAATFTLVFYDILTLGIFLWLWVFGYLWWFRRGSMHRTARRRRGVGEVEMARMGMPVRYGDGRYEREWARTGRVYGRVRSESEQRASSARDAELEGEMRRLGMI